MTLQLKTLLIITYLNLPSCEVKNQIICYKVKWFKLKFKLN